MMTTTQPWSTCILATLAFAFGSTACTDTEDDTNQPTASAEATFAQRLIGKFERVSTVPAPDGSTAYLRETVTNRESESPQTVMESVTFEVFFDEALTQLVLSYESTGPCEVVGTSSIPDGFEVNCTNDTSFLTVSVTDPALLEGLGIDDCNLTAGVPRDVSDGCAAPTFRFSNCVDQDVFSLSADGSRFQWGDQTVDHCAERPTELEPEAFVRVP